MFERADQLPPSLPLERLDEVPWMHLRHAYGPAIDVPDQLRALAGSSDEDRDHALWKLFGNVIHQGTQYESAAFVVPFLVGMLADHTLQQDLVELLLALAIGFEESWFPYGFDPTVHTIPDTDAENPYGLDLISAYHRVAQASAHYVQLLDHPETGAAAARLLGYLPTEAEKTLPELTARLHHAADHVWPSVALSVAMLSREAGPAAGVDRALQRELPLACRVAGMCARSILGDRSVEPELIELLADDLPPIGRWMEGSTETTVLAVLTMHPGWLNRDRLQAFRQPLSTVSWEQATLIAGHMLWEAFGRELPPERSRSLEPLQRELLQLLIDARTHDYDTFLNWSLIFQNRMLPSDRNDLRRYLDGAPLSTVLPPALGTRLRNQRKKRRRERLRRLITGRSRH